MESGKLLLGLVWCSFVYVMFIRENESDKLFKRLQSEMDAHFERKTQELMERMDYPDDDEY